MLENTFYQNQKTEEETISDKDKTPDQKESNVTDKRIPEYDAGYKKICSVKVELLHFLKKYIGADWMKNLTVEDIRPCPNELILPDYEKRIPDLLFEIQRGEEWIGCYLILQMQSAVDFTMVFRFASEMHGILMKSFLQYEKKERERKRYRIPAAIPILLYNGKNKWTAAGSFRDYQRNGNEYGSYILDFKYYVIDISRISDSMILDSNYLIDSIIYLDKHRHDLKNLLENLSVILERVGEMEAEKKMMFWEWMEHVFVVSVDEKYQKKIKEIIENAKGEEKMFKYAITDMIETTMRKERATGRMEGRTEGRMAENINVIIRKLDQGLSAESIAYWLDKEEDFVKRIEQLHCTYPKADDEELAEYYFNSFMGR